MMRFISIFLFLFHCLSSFAVDFDVIVVGSSPIPLLEALYQSHSGKRVLIIEESPECGGAWKSIDICGIYPVDLGCHTLGSDRLLHNFLEEYVGCTMVSMDNPHLPFDTGKSPNGFYPAHGCYEIIHNLLQLIEKTDIVLLLDHTLESVFIDTNEPIAIAKTKSGNFSTSKIFVTPYSNIIIENPLTPSKSRDKAKYYHLYMLIEDPTPLRFSFRNSIASGISRLMNLTYFVGLEDSGTQLIVFQTYGDTYLQSAETYLEVLKKQNLLADSARIIKAEPYIYEQSYYQSNSIKNAHAIFEMLSTNHIQGMSKYIPKWKEILQPFHKAMTVSNTSKKT
jgi:hypothetical protein